MAHFAQLDENNTVMQVIVVHNNELLDADGKENEFRGVAFCKSLFGEDTVWYQTSYTKSIRKNFAGVGFTYDSQRDAFVPPRPFDSWTLDEEVCQWVSPIPYPQDGNMYNWNEKSQSWVAFAQP